MRTVIGALVMGLALSPLALAQDGGKLAWRGKAKDKDDPKTAMADAKKTGKPMMVFFTSEG